MARVLIIEDDHDINTAFQMSLSKRGHSVTGTFLGREGVRLSLASPPPEIVILDLMLPDLDGFEVCRQIRAESSVPIIMMTARHEGADTVLGLETGADDYVVKPVEPYVLDARIRAVLRRAAVPADAAEFERIVAVGDLVIDHNSLLVHKNGQQIDVGPTELRLLLELSTNLNRVLSRQQLLASVWGTHYEGETRMVDVTIQRLRKRIEDDPSRPKLIITVRGFGYRLNSIKETLT